MILSRTQIEVIGSAFILEFEQHCGPIPDHFHDLARNAFPIERFATEHLGLEVSMAELSPDSSICGLTAYADTEYHISNGNCTYTIPLHRKQVLIDSHLAAASQTGRRRFTLAHECAHQILFAFEDAAMQKARQAAYAQRSSYSLRELKTKEDWNEWQADTLAAALLIPINKLKDVRCQMSQKEPIRCYGTKLDARSYADLNALCHTFLVSKSAMLIRLRQIGAVIDLPISEWRDPLEVWP